MKKGICHPDRKKKESDSEEETSGWQTGRTVLRGWLQAGPNSLIGGSGEAGEETKWWRDYNVLQEAILHVNCEGICLQIHCGYISSPRFVLDHLQLSFLIGPFSRAKPGIHSVYCLMQINLDGVGGEDKHRRGRVLTVWDTWGVFFGAKWEAFLSDMFTIPPGTKIRETALFSTSKSVTLITVIMMCCHIS